MAIEIPKAPDTSLIQAEIRAHQCRIVELRELLRLAAAQEVTALRTGRDVGRSPGCDTNEQGRCHAARG